MDKRSLSVLNLHDVVYESSMLKKEHTYREKTIFIFKYECCQCICTWNSFINWSLLFQGKSKDRDAFEIRRLHHE